MTSLHAICGLGPPQSKTLATPMVDYQCFGGLRPQTAFQWQQACYVFRGTVLAWGAHFSFGGTQAVL